MRADPVLVNGDPTTDIDRVRDLASIWKNGYPVPRTPTP
jgi:imidazolonepropionase-like amidohydrolase